jgi:hypothetical protein
VVHQKRYLLYSIQNLYEKFCFENEGEDVCRTTFYELRPFFVMKPKLNDREQCLCLKCSNLQVLICLKYILCADY